MTKEKYDTLGEFIKNNALTLTLQLLGVVVLLANLWITSKLSPLAESVSRVASRVDAIEQSDDKNEQLIPRFYALEANYGNVQESLTRIEGKVDRLIQSRYTSQVN